MAELATITSKRQLTIPVAIFDDLNLQQGQRVLVYQDKGTIRIEPALDLVDQLAGSVKLPKRFKGMSIDKVITKAKKEYFSQK